MVVASGILATGLVTSWELVRKLPQKGEATPRSGSQSPPPASESTTRTVTDLQTVTVTEYVSGQGTQQVSTSQQSTSSSQASSSTSQSAPPGYVLVTPLSALSGRTSAYFDHPSRGL